MNWCMHPRQIQGAYVPLQDDPLDAFMAELKQDIAAQPNGDAAGGKAGQVKQKDVGLDEEEDHVADFLEVGHQTVYI